MRMTIKTPQMSINIFFQIKLKSCFELNQNKDVKRYDQKVSSRIIISSSTEKTYTTNWLVLIQNDIRNKKVTNKRRWRLYYREFVRLWISEESL